MQSARLATEMDTRTTMVGIVSSAGRKHATKCCCKLIAVRGSFSSPSVASVASRSASGEISLLAFGKCRAYATAYNVHGGFVVGTAY